MNIFEMDDYKLALKLFIRTKDKKAQKGIFKNIAEYLGVHATLISQILSGSKDFTEEQIYSVCEYLGIPELESQYLLILVQIERAGTVKLKKHYQNMKLKMQKESLQISNRVEKHKTLTDAEKSIFYSSWIYPTIHLMSSLDKPVDFDSICRKLQLPQRKVREILNQLIKFQMINEKDGRYITGSTMTHLDRNSPYISKHHTNWRLKAIQACETLSEEELMYSGNFSVNKKDFKLFREELVQVIQKFVTFIKDSPAEEVAQFNIDFFWITQVD